MMTRPPFWGARFDALVPGSGAGAGSRPPQTDSEAEHREELLLRRHLSRPFAVAVAGSGSGSDSGGARGEAARHWSLGAGELPLFVTGDGDGDAAGTDAA